MRKKIAVILVMGWFVLQVSKPSFAMMGMCGTHKTSSSAPKAAEEVGNKICPVSGEKITEEAKAAYEYKGKAYNFCCPACIDEFKKAPRKHIKKLEAAKAEKPSGHEGHTGHSH